MMKFLHLELTSRCNKACWMCGRRKIERDHPELCDWGDMPLDLVEHIAAQVPRDTIVQLHNNGEPLLYPYLANAIHAFTHCYTQFNTNAILLYERRMDLMALDRLTISVIENDPLAEAQYETVIAYLDFKGDTSPQMVYRLLGEVDPTRWQSLPGTVCKRTLHRPDGSRGYRKAVTIPEVGFCIEPFTHLAIDRDGNASLCVRFDPKGDLRLGNLRRTSLEEIWHSEKRRHYLFMHVIGKRSDLPGCKDCDFYGCPTG